MIQEIVTCDTCDYMVPLVGSMVPRSWVTHMSKHYCSPQCFTVTVTGGDPE